MRVIYLIWVVTLLGGCIAEPTSAPSPPSPITYRHEVRDNPKLHLHIVTIDLSDARVQLVAAPCGDDPDGDGPWQMTLSTVRETAKREGLDVAVNANFFAARTAVNLGGRRVPYFGGNWAVAVGWLMCDGRLISGKPAAASLVVARDGRVRIGHFDALPADARQVVSGSQQVVTNGGATGHGDKLAPHTVAGMNADGTKLTLLVVDGRLMSHSVGMTEAQLAREMLKLGCTDAVNLDGGGSSTVVMRKTGADEWVVLNRPSDGHDLPIPLSIERNVACVLGIRLSR